MCEQAHSWRTRRCCASLEEALGRSPGSPANRMRRGSRRHTRGGSEERADAEGEEQQLNQALSNVASSAERMKQFLDEGSVREAIKETSANLLAELKTGSLSPRVYYALYSRIFDALSVLEQHFARSARHGPQALELFETVQYAGNIVPRLYLLVTVGKAYVQHNPSSAKDVLHDLVNMARGVQHPIRGLFLRAYLTDASRAMLPSGHDESVASVHNSVDFILENFEEMNKLWCRMQRSIDRENKYTERQQLRDLIGKNLLVLSQLDGVDMALYREKVLPKILEQVVNCEDSLAQPYLMDAVVQAFPDEYHLATLDKFLDGSRHLNALVSVGDVLAGLMSRLASYASESDEGQKEVDEARAFQRFSAIIGNLCVDYPDMEPRKVAHAHSALLNFTLEAHEERLDEVDEVFASCSRLLQSNRHVHEASEELNGMLNTVLYHYDFIEVLGLDSFPDVMELLPHEEHKKMAKQIVETLVERNAVIDSSEDVKLLMRLVSPLLDWPAGTQDADEFEDEQTMVAKMVHQLRSDDTKKQSEIQQLFKLRVLSVGEHRRLRCILPSLFFRTLVLVKAMHAESSHNVVAELQKAYQLAERFGELPQQGERALRLFLNLIPVADEVQLEDMAYQALEKVGDLFEMSLGTWQERYAALSHIVGTLQRTTVFSQANWKAATRSVEAYCATILRKADQSRALALCAHLHQLRNPEALASSTSAASSGKDEDLRESSKNRSLGRLKNDEQQSPEWTVKSSKPNCREKSGEHVAVNLHVGEEGRGSVEIALQENAVWNGSKDANVEESASERISHCLQRAVECADVDARQKHASLGRQHPNVVLYADLVSKHVYFLCAGQPGVSASGVQSLWQQVLDMLDRQYDDDREACSEARRRLNALERYVRRKERLDALPESSRR